MQHTDDVKLINPRNAPVDFINIVLKAVKKYEKQPNRRSMIDDEMTHHMEKKRAHLDPDSLEAALTDWTYLGRFVGFRSIEWCQTSEQCYLKIDHPNWTREASYAFIAKDWVFYNSSKQRIDDLSKVTISDIAYFTVEFRKQKNDVNGEVIPYAKDSENPEFCPVCAALRIVQRALRLEVAPEEPIAVHLQSVGRNRGKRCYITATDTACFLRKVAATVYSLKANDKALRRFSSHSIRVTAACLLHRQNMSDTYIQTRLRWRSNAFLDYLRNTLYTAHAHTKALHISKNNLPANTRRYVTAAVSPRHTAAGHIGLSEDPSGTTLPRHRGSEEIEGVLTAGAGAPAA